MTSLIKYKLSVMTRYTSVEHSTKNLLSINAPTDLIQPVSISYTVQAALGRRFAQHSHQRLDA